MNHFPISSSVWFAIIVISAEINFTVPTDNVPGRSEMEIVLIVSDRGSLGNAFVSLGIYRKTREMKRAKAFIFN